MRCYHPAPDSARHEPRAIVEQFLKKSRPLVAFVKGLRATQREFDLATAKLKVRKRDGYLLSVYGIWMRDRWEDATFRYCIQGDYGFFYADWLREQDDCILLDIGANMGLYSLIASTNPGSGRFMPSSRCRRPSGTLSTT